jgi:type II secretory pathway pseudopilin PulG
MRRPLPPARGFTYLMLLWWVVISGVMLMALGRSWGVDAQRQREAELVFRGEQIRAALVSYRRADESAGQYPPTLQALLEDKRGPTLRRHLRQLWPDPITGQPGWGLIRDEANGIRGVYSLSQRAPLAGPVGALTYADWRFDADSIPD